MKMRSAIDSAIVLAIIIAGAFLLPEDAVRNWYDHDKAQIVVRHDVPSFNDDVIGNSLGWVGEHVLVPVWNFAFRNDLFRNTVAPMLAVAFVGVLVADIYNAFKEPSDASK